MLDRTTIQFKIFQIVEVKLPKDDRSDNGKLRGYGYVEFEERSDLKAALAMTDTVSFAHRSV
jgi:RNA recognition motif-containing protein